MAEKLDILCGDKHFRLMLDSQMKEQLMEGHVGLGSYMQQLQNSKLFGGEWLTEEECENAAIIVDVDENSMEEPGVSESVIQVSEGISLTGLQEEESKMHVWPESAVQMLIDEYKAHQAEVESYEMKKKTLFTLMSGKLKMNGYDVSPSQCGGKWMAIVRRYKKASQHNSQTENTPMHCPFQEQLEELFKVPDNESLTDDNTDNNQNPNNESNKSTYYTWSEAATKLLIYEWRACKAKLDSRLIKKNTMWKEISSKMKSNGYNFSPFQCENKWQGMKRRYRYVLKHNSKGKKKLQCQFEEELGEILGGPDSLSFTGSNNESDGFKNDIWPAAAKKILISEYRAREDKLESGQFRKKTLWNAISNKLKMKGYNVSSLQCEKKLKDSMRRYRKGSKHNSKIRNKEVGDVLHNDASDSPTSECSSLTGVKSNSILRNLLLKTHASVAHQVVPPQLPSCGSPSVTPSSPTRSPPPLTGAPRTTRKWKLNKFKLKPARLETRKKHQDRLNRVKAILESGNKHQGRLSRERLEAMENSVREFSQTMFSIFEKYMGNLRKDD